MKRRYIILAVLVAALAVGCAGATAGGPPDWWSDSQHMTDQVARAAQSAVPLPLAQIQAGGFLERKNLAERLIRFSKANKVGYLYLMSFGKFVGYYVVKGKVSSVNSQMTNADQTWNTPGTDTVVGSIGDDGSWGPNEGGDRGVFFFTSNGTMVETTLDWVYSDTPLNIDVPNLLK